MPRFPTVVTCALCLCLLAAAPARGQTVPDRRQYPSLLVGALVEVNVGRIGSPFSAAQLQPGHSVGDVEVPGLGVRVSIGRHLSERLSAQLLYLRPARWVRYHNINGSTTSRTVWTNVMGATVTARHPLAEGLGVYGEGGLAVVTRHGFELDQRPVVDDTVHVAPVLGGGIEYQWTPRWGFKTGFTYIPARTSASQPHTFFGSGGFTYRVTPAMQGFAGGRPVESSGGDEQLFPEHLVQAGYTTDALGYAFNRAMTPVFWQGNAEVGSGATFHYQRNVFHTERSFSIDWGVSFSYGRSRRDGNGFAALSVYPLFRWTALRTEPADLYFSYSLAGPTLITAGVLDGEDTGRNFTFQDLIGVGLYTGRSHRLNVELRIGHYSNGNILPRNAGIRVPVTLNLGYAF